ncbi:hypothetical protein [Shinella sp.]|uniref:hypothetical protein n=1 Tax=Shinella sp. TaxID=1870904 RepID=UPI00299FD59B|nr:hypothetical protein [Shinella sp.]MDX3973496.1 hypothetical protein [Shinella sp.]
MHNKVKPTLWCYLKMNIASIKPLIEKECSVFAKIIEDHLNILINHRSIQLRDKNPDKYIRRITSTVIEGLSGDKLKHAIETEIESIRTTRKLHFASTPWFVLYYIYGDFIMETKEKYMEEFAQWQKDCAKEEAGVLKKTACQFGALTTTTAGVAAMGLIYAGTGSLSQSFAIASMFTGITAATNYAAYHIQKRMISPT